MARPYNRTEQASVKTGWLFFAENQRRAIGRAIEQLNKEGYKVVFITEDRWSLLQKIIQFIVFVCTVGFFGRRPSVLVVGELINPEAETKEDE